jgi:hypothetical protein
MNPPDKRETRPKRRVASRINESLVVQNGKAIRNENKVFRIGARRLFTKIVIQKRSLSSLEVGGSRFAAAKYADLRPHSSALALAVLSQNKLDMAAKRKTGLER